MFRNVFPHVNGSRIILVLSVFVLTAAVGCASPEGFVKTTKPQRAEIQIKEDLSYDQAWSRTVDRVVRRFDVEMMEKDTGYLRTAWLYSWTGEQRQDYRVRLKVKFNKEDHTVAIISEAQYGGPDSWVNGSDTELLEKIKSDLMGSLGRTTR